MVYLHFLSGSIITQAISKQRTDLQVALFNFVKRKHLIEELNQFGITSTYDEFLLFKGSAAYAATENSQRGCATTEDNQKLVQGFLDNFDANILSQNGLKQTYSMAFIITQEHKTIEKPRQYLELVKRKSKKKLSSLPKQEITVQRYKGPSNPPMPSEAARYELLPLSVLARAALSINRANDNDFHFMNLISSGVGISEYNGYNTKIAREAGQGLRPATDITYLPPINMNPAEPDTVLTTMHLVKSETEKAGQEYTVFTNDQQLFKIATQVTWWSPDEWKVFFPLLGGIRTLMSFVGCIETLMTNTDLSDLLKAAFGGVDRILQRKTFPQNARHYEFVLRKF